MISKQIGKLLRQFNQNKPIRLQLNGILSKQSLDFILAGLKNTEIVSELNLSDNQFDDDDLYKICERLSNGVSLNRLKLNQNAFEDP